MPHDIGFTLSCLQDIELSSENDGIETGVQDEIVHAVNVVSVFYFTWFAFVYCFQISKAQFFKCVVANSS